MSHIFDWIKNKKKWIAIGVFCAITIPLIIIHLLYSFSAATPFFVAHWEAGDLLSYLTGWISLSGTLILGFVTVYQTKKANDLSIKLAEENNALQRVAIQNQLPVIRATDVRITRTYPRGKSYDPERGHIVSYQTFSEQERSNKVDISLGPDVKTRFQKDIALKFTNVSSTTLKSVRFVAAAFHGYSYDNTSGDSIVLFGNCNFNTHKMLLLPDEDLDLKINIFLDDDNRINFWDYDDGKALGSFDINLYIENTSITGITFYERVYISQSGKTPVKVVHDQYEMSDLDQYR